MGSRRRKRGEASLQSMPRRHTRHHHIHRKRQRYRKHQLMVAAAAVEQVGIGIGRQRLEQCEGNGGAAPGEVLWAWSCGIMRACGPASEHHAWTSYRLCINPRSARSGLSRRWRAVHIALWHWAATPRPAKRARSNGWQMWSSVPWPPYPSNAARRLGPPFA